MRRPEGSDQGHKGRVPGWGVARAQAHGQGAGLRAVPSGHRAYVSLKSLM